MLKPTPIHLNPEALRRQKLRNSAIFGALMSFVILVFVISLVKVTGRH